MSAAGGASKGSQTTRVITDKVLGSFKPEKTFSYHQDASITSLDFDDSGQYLISAGIDKSIQLYDVHKGVHHKDIKSQKYGAHAARFTHHELNCLYASTPTEKLEVDHAIRYLSLADNQYIRYFKGHKEQVMSIDVDPIQDIFLSSSLDKSVKMWDLRTSSAIGHVEVGQPSTIAFDPSGIVFAMGRYPNPLSTATHGTLSFYDVRTFDKRPFMEVEVPTLQGQVWNKIEFSNNGKLVLISTDSPEHYLVDAFSGQVLTTLSMAPVGTNSIYSGDWMTFKYPYSGSTCFSPCGKFVIAGSPFQSISIFDTNGIKTTEGKTHAVGPDDNPKRLSPLKKIDTDQGIPKIVAFNPKLLTLATADNVVSLWLPHIDNI